MNLEYYFSLYLFLMSMLMFGYYSKYMMMISISLEFMVIFMIYNMYLILMYLNIMYYMIMFMLVVSVCESVLMLSMVVLMVRMQGNDQTYFLTLKMW